MFLGHCGERSLCSRNGGAWHDVPDELMTVHDKGLERPVDVVAGNLVIRLAETEEEVIAAQKLRYQVFYEDMKAKPTAEMKSLARDFDSFDAHCDHLLVLDLGPVGSQPQAVGTYRLMRRSAARLQGRFYTSNEYDISSILAYPGEILELGRSCVASAYRNGVTMALLWRGIAAYTRHHSIEVMFGCASLPGTDPRAVGPQLAYLHRHHLAPETLRPRALPERVIEIDLDLDEDDLRRGRLALPPLIKGYLWLGGFVGEGAVVDYKFGTTDICVVVRTDAVAKRYLKRYRRDEIPSPDDGESAVSNSNMRQVT